MMNPAARRLSEIIFFSFLTLCVGIKDLFSQEVMIKTFTVQDGLVMNRIRGFHQDHSGFIWIYTWDGLSRYEGYRFRNYTTGQELSHGLINDMLEDHDGTLYVALNDGTLEVIKGSDVHPELRSKGPIINYFFPDQRGKILVGTDDQGICWFDNGRCKRLTSVNDAVMTAVVSNNLVYSATPNRLQVSKLNYKNAEPSEEVILKQWVMEFDYFEHIYQDHKGNILVCTIEGIRQIKPAGNAAFQLTYPDFFPSDVKWKDWQVKSILQSADGTYWIGTMNGLIRMNDKKEWSLLTSLDGLPSNRVTSLFIDKSQNLWIGTELGAARINLLNKISRFNSLPCDYVNYLLPDSKGGMYCLCGNQKIIQTDSFGIITQEANVPDAIGIIQKDQHLTVVKSDGIQTSSWQTGDEKPYDFASTKFMAEIGGYVFISSAFEILCCSSPLECNPSPVHHRIEALQHYNGNELLVGTWNDGLFLADTREDSGACSLNIIRDLNQWLPAKEIRSLLVDRKKNIWIGTRFHGLVRLKCDDAFGNCQSALFTMADGLTSNWITSLAEDQTGNIWVASISGLDKIIDEGDHYRVFSFSRVSGFYALINHVNIGTDNAVWCGTYSGLVRIKDGMLDTISPPPTFITEAVLGGENKVPDLSSVISLPFNRNSVNFAFSAPDPVNENQLPFSYRLLGRGDTLWSKPSNHHVIHYGNLLPGSYKFEVASYGWNGKRGTSAAYSFKILPPFWRQSWFILLISMVIAFILYRIYLFRIGQIQRIQVVRDRIASDLHDEIGSSLSHVNILSEIGKQSIHDDGKSIEIFNRIGTEAQYSSEALDDIIWSVKTRWDSIEAVIARMRQYATELFESSGIRFEMHEVITVDQQFDMEFRRDFYLAFKELLRNIVRHANASQVDIDIVINPGLVRLSVHDNGKGFEVNDPTQRNGITNIKDRAKRWHGQAVWKSEPRMGTHVDVEMKPG